MWIIEILSVILIIFSIFRGIKKNLTSNILSFLRYLISIIIAITIAPNTITLLEKITVLHNHYHNLLSFLLIFITSYLFFTLLIFLQKMIVEIRFIPPLEKPFGVIFGITNGILSIFLLCHILSFISSKTVESITKNSIIYEKMLNISEQTSKILLKN